MSYPVPVKASESALSGPATLQSQIAKIESLPDRAHLSLLLVLSITHWFVDFCGGITAPMIPRMEMKFGLTLGGVAWIITFMSFAANFSQPFAGWLMDRSRTPAIILLCPLLSGVSFMIGLTSEPWQAAILFLIAGTAIGAFHPSAYVLAQQTMPRRPALASAIFISFGVLGVSTGAMVSGFWMEHRGFDMFHIFAFFGVSITAMLLFRRVQRIELAPFLQFARPAEKGSAHAAEARHNVHFALLWVAGFLMAFENGTMLFFVPKYFKTIYGSEALGGQACFFFAILGGLSSFYYAHRADRGNPLRVAMFVQLLSFAPMVGFFVFSSAPARIGMMMLMGLTLGGTIPLVMSLARNAKGLTVGLRTSLLMGGIWGMTAIANLAMAQLPSLGLTLPQVMSLILVAPVLAVPLLGFAATKLVKPHTNVQK